MDRRELQSEVLTPSEVRPEREELRMWIMTTVGFFSVVKKSGDCDLLTVRARVHSDLESLRERFMPELGQTLEGKGTDYRFRAKISPEAFAEGMKRLALDIGYSNFKNEVHKVQGPKRAGVYSAVWHDLNRLVEEKQ